MQNNIQITKQADNIVSDINYRITDITDPLAEINNIVVVYEELTEEEKATVDAFRTLMESKA